VAENKLKQQMLQKILLSRILTKSSKPRSVPTISLSFFIIIWIFEPIHLSTISATTNETVQLCAQFSLFKTSITTVTIPSITTRL